MKRTLLFLFVFCSLMRSASASHIMGADMQYKCLGNGKYKIIAKVYRDCRGIAFNSPSFGVFAGLNGGNGCGSNSLTITRTGIKDITPRCSTASSPCYPANTYGTGEGLEEHTYETTVDFNTSPLNSYVSKSSCCEVTFYIGQCCRYSYNGYTTNDFYSTCMINICNIAKTVNKCNSSAQLNKPPVLFVCCNQAYYSNVGAIDTVDFDSFTYHMVPALGGLPNTSIGYPSPFSYLYPITPYCNPPTTIKCTPTPKSDPPKGFFLDSMSGDMVFTPTKCDEVAIAVVEITEWRKDSASGKYIAVGRTRRDVQYIVRDDCGFNKSPKIDGPFYNYVCEGDKICITITAKDETFSPYQSPPDTVKLTWNSNIKDATFKITDTTAREKEATFCWQTKAGNARDNSYTFLAMATDQHCPKPAIASRSFMVKVNKRQKGKIKYSKQPCGMLVLNGIGDSSYSATQNYTWKVTDTLGKTVFNSTHKNDTLRKMKVGKYYLKLTLNSKYNCPVTISDSVRMPELPKVFVGNDTFSCFNYSFQANVNKISFAKSPFKYQWHRTNLRLIEDTFSYLNIPHVVSDTVLFLTITDSNGCIFKDTQTIRVKPLPKINLGADQRICSYGSVQFDAQNADTVKYLWNTNEKTKKISAHIAGNYSVIVTENNYHCTNYDTIHLFVNDTVKALAGQDNTICTGLSTLLSADALPKSLTTQYQWYSILNNSLIGFNKDYNLNLVNPNGNGGKSIVYPFELKVTVSQSKLNCIDKDTVYITVNSNPVVAWTKSPLDAYCHNSGDFLLSDFIVEPKTNLWDSNSLKITANVPVWNKKPLIKKGLKSFTYVVSLFDNAYLQYGSTETNQFTMQFTDTNGCINSAKTSISIKGNPPIALKPARYCQDLGEAPLANNVTTVLNSNPFKYLWQIVSVPAGVFPDTLIKDKNVGTGKLPAYFLSFGPKSSIAFGGDYLLRFTVYDTLNGCISSDTTTIKVFDEPLVKSTQALITSCAELKFSNLLNNITVWGLKEKPDSGLFEVIAKNNNRKDADVKSFNLDSGHYFPLKNHIALWTLKYNKWENTCYGSDSFDLRVWPSPIASFITNPDNNVTKDFPNFLVTNKSIISDTSKLQYEWYFGYGIPEKTTNAAEPFISFPPVDGTYKIKLIATSNHTCKDTFYKMLIVGKGASVNLSHPLPDGLFIDKDFIISGVEFRKIRLQVYDMAGKMVAENYKNEGLRLPMGTYVFYCEIQLYNGNNIAIKGKKFIE